VIGDDTARDLIGQVEMRVDIMEQKLSGLLAKNKE
jgi:hypothetical protein